MRQMRRCCSDESGAELVEWAVVTVILILATYALLQAVGPQLTQIYIVVRDALARLLG